MAPEAAAAMQIQWQRRSDPWSWPDAWGGSFRQTWYVPMANQLLVSEACWSMTVACMPPLLTGEAGVKSCHPEPSTLEDLITGVGFVAHCAQGTPFARALRTSKSIALRSASGTQLRTSRVRRNINGENSSGPAIYSSTFAAAWRNRGSGSSNRSGTASRNTA